MTLAALGSPTPWPYWPHAKHENTGVTGMQINASAEENAQIVICPVAGTINGIRFQTENNPSSGGGTIRADVETVAGNGEPSGTLHTAGATGTVVTTGTDYQEYLVTLGTAITVSAGDLIAIVLSFDSYVSGNDIDVAVAQITRTQTVRVFSSTNSGSSWTDSNSTGPMIALDYDDGANPDITRVPKSSWFGIRTSEATASNGRYKGGKFRLPFRARLCGLIGQSRSAEAGNSQDVDFALFADGDTPSDTPLYEYTCSKHHYTSNNWYGLGPLTFDEDDESNWPILEADTTYRLVWKLSSGANHYFRGARFGSLEILEANSWYGTDGSNHFMWQTVADSGDLTWTDYDSVDDPDPVLAPLELLLDQIDVSDGGGGASIFPPAAIVPI